MSSQSIPDQEERPWITLKTSYDVEAWIDQFNRSLQQFGPNIKATGHGICLRLAHGGEIYIHTTSEGEVLLDVTEEASWVVPVIASATGLTAPHSSIWQMQSDTLTQLLLGLSSLIATTRIVLQHDYRIKKGFKG
jgi:hypothetical protein